MTRAIRIGIAVAAVAVAVVLVILRPGADRAVPTPTPAPTSPSAPLPRLVDVGAGSCIPCKMMAPILEELRRDYASVLRVDVFDLRQDRAPATQYGVRVIPTQIFYDGSGRELFRHEGFMSKSDILDKWRELGVTLPARPAAAGGG